MFERYTKLEDDDIDALFCVITIKSQRMLVCSMYIPPNNVQKLNKLFQLISAAQSAMTSLKCSGMMVAGDFNARHTDWGDRTCNSHGAALSDYLRQSHLSAINQTSQNTFLCENGGSTIDLTIATPNLTLKCTRPWTDPEIELFSGAPIRGHIPVWYEFSICKSKQGNTETYDWSKANWQLYHDRLEHLSKSLFPTAATIDDPYMLDQMIHQLLTQCKRESIPIKIILCHSKPYWSKEHTAITVAP